MKPAPATLRVAAFLALISAVPCTSPGQYLYLDTNGNGVNDAADYLALGCPTSVDVWLDTEHDGSGAPEACNTADGALNLYSYELILNAVGGTVDWIDYTDQAAGPALVQFPGSYFEGPTEFRVTYYGNSASPPGRYRLGTVRVVPTGGTPRIVLAATSGTDCRARTSFGTECSGTQGDFTYRLNEDWTDTGGTGPPADLLPPVVTAPATVSVDENSPLTFTVTATDCEPIDSLNADLSPLPSGATFTTSPDRTSGTVVWTPTLTDAGTYTVSFTARNLLTGTATTTITVNNVVNLIPYAAPDYRYQEYGLETPYPSGIESPGFDDSGFPAGPAPFTDNGGCITATVRSPWAINSHLAVRRRLSLPSAAVGGTLRFVIDNDVVLYVNGTEVRSVVHDGCAQYGDFTQAVPDGLLHAGENVVVALCTDRGAATFFDLALSASGLGPIVTAEASYDLMGGDVLDQVVTAVDPDGDPIASLTADLSGLPAGSGATFTTIPDRTQGTLHWQTATSDSGSFSVTFTAANSLVTTAVTVYHVTPTDRPPVVTAPAFVAGAEGALLAVPVSAADPDGHAIDLLSADLGALPAGNDAVFAAAPPYAAGTLTWTPTFADSGDYGVIFTATNLLVGRDTTRIHIANVGRPPAFAPADPESVWEGEPLAFAVVASDPDDDPLVYSLLCGPAGSAFDPPSRTISWTPSFTAARAESACIVASDGALADTIVVPIVVFDVTPGPRILAVTDIPGDQGGWVDVHWKRSQYDAPGDGVVVTGYALYRRIDPLPPLAGGIRSGTLAARARATGALSQYPPGDWQYVLTAPARLERNYHVVAGTLADSTIAAGGHETIYFVSALTQDVEIFYDSAPDSGHSVDNLAPSVPDPLFALTFPGPQVQLTWGRVPEADARWYSVHRGPTADFVPAPANRLGATADTFYLDAAPGLGNLVYKVAAVDFAGNVGDAAGVSVQVTNTPGTGAVPRALVLAPARPNPATSTARLGFELPEEGSLTLEVIGTDGRLVRRITRESLPAGDHVRIWDLRDDRGRPVATGVYVCRLTFRGASESRKIAVLR